MINRLFLVFSTCLVLAACATPPVVPEKSEEATAPLSGIDAYREMSGRFFYIDEQDFPAVTCRIEVPKLSEILEAARTQLTSSSYTATLVEDMSGFGITYSPAQGVSFTSPKVEVVISRVEGVEPPERLKEGVRKFEEGFAIQIIAVQNQLRGILDLMSAPGMEDIADASVTREDGRAVFTYLREGIRVEEAFSDNMREMLSESGTVRLLLRTEYRSIAGGRPALSAAHIEANQPMGNVVSDIKVELQEVGGIRFLKRVGIAVSTRGQAIKDNATFDIFLRDCRLHE
jgi:hypothetical protein